jgi:hypothetical protein
MMNEGCAEKIIGIVVFAIIGGITSYFSAIGLGGYMFVATVLICIYLYVSKHYRRNKMLKIPLSVFLKEFGIEKESIFHCNKLIGDSEAFHTQNGTFIAIDDEGTMVEIYTVFVMRTDDYDEWINRLLKDFEDRKDVGFSHVNLFYPKVGDEITDEFGIYNLKYTIDTELASDDLYAILASFVKEHEPETKILSEMEVIDSGGHYILHFQNGALIQCWTGKIGEDSKVKKECLDERLWSLNFVKSNKDVKKLEVKIIHAR